MGSGGACEAEGEHGCRGLTEKLSLVSMGSPCRPLPGVSTIISSRRASSPTRMLDSARAALNSWALISPSLFLSSRAAPKVQRGSSLERFLLVKAMES